MAMPSDFHLSQGSLQDFVDCRRRFQLRYLKRFSWPASVSEPAAEHERRMLMGARLHHLIQQHRFGVPAARLSVMAGDPELQRWWQNYLQAAPADLPERQKVELILSTPFAGFRLMAKYDLLALEPGRSAVIVDWKTSPHPPGRNALAERLQTKVYPYVLVRAGTQVNQGAAIQPGQVEMVYWFASHPHSPQRFAYDDTQYQVDEAFLTALVEQIVSMGGQDFERTPDARRCRYCVYRSFCERGEQAGAWDAWDEDGEQEEALELDLDFDQIAEIEY